MEITPPAVGSTIRIEKPALQFVVDRLTELGYLVVGPQVVDGAVAHDELRSIEQLPIGYVDEQEPGQYRLRKTNADSYFDYVVGPHSLKNYLFPPCQSVCKAVKTGEDWSIEPTPLPTQPVAAIGVRACDLHALRIQDKVFLEQAYIDEAYRSRREGLFIAAVNCRRAADTCFCHSVGNGPRVAPGDGEGTDLVFTELDDSFVVSVSTERGSDALTRTPHAACTPAEAHAADSVSTALLERMRNELGEASGAGRRRLNTERVHDLLLDNLTHPQWGDIADRCLSCANCTMVCPTCFCSSVEEVTDLTGEEVTRERRWDSCFTAEHSRVHSGTVRKSTASRYRQWLTHKLATWTDQFGEIGCVGCGRCITWCPVGIDLTAEVAAIEEDRSR